VTQLNVATIVALARAPAPPAPTIEGAVSTDTTLNWRAVPAASAYVVRWRRTDASQWEQQVRVPGNATSHVLAHVRVDDWVFGVSSVAADGSESPVASAVPGGAFVPLPPPAARP